MRAGWHIGDAEGDEPVDFVIGMHWRQLWRLAARPWVPFAFARMVLPAAPATLQTRLGVVRAGPVVRQRWRSRAELDVWARDRRHAHAPAWSRFHREAGATTAWGVWHEVRPARPDEQRAQGLAGSGPPTARGGRRPDA